MNLQQRWSLRIHAAIFKLKKNEEVEQNIGVDHSCLKKCWARALSSDDGGSSIILLKLKSIYAVFLWMHHETLEAIPQRWWFRGDSPRDLWYHGAAGYCWGSLVRKLWMTGESMFKVDMEAHDWFARSYDKGKSFAPNPQAFLNLDSRSLFQLEF